MTILNQDSDETNSMSDFPSRKSSISTYVPIEPAVKSGLVSSSSESNRKSSVSTISGDSLPSLKNHPIAAARNLEFDEKSDISKSSSSFTHDTMSTAYKDLVKKEADKDDELMHQLQ